MCAFGQDNVKDQNRWLAFLLQPGETVLDVLAATDNKNCLELHVFVMAMMDNLHIQILNRSGFWGMYGNPPPLPAHLPSLALASYSMAFLGSGQFVCLEYIWPESPPCSPPPHVATRSRAPHTSVISSKELEEAMGAVVLSSLHAAIEIHECSTCCESTPGTGREWRRKGRAKMSEACGSWGQCQRIPIAPTWPISMRTMHKSVQLQSGLNQAWERSWEGGV